MVDLTDVYGAQVTCLNYLSPANEDYIMDSQVVRFSPLDTIRRATVPILDDGIVEGREDFIGQIRILPTGPSVEVINGTTTIVILDDDGRVCECVCVCICVCLCI